LFRDVNVPSKAFGELVEAERHTPSVTAQELQARLDAGNKPVVLDARRFEEYRVMNIPGSISVPGAELVLRARELAPDPATPIVVNCAGRTRSIIGAQSLINAGIPNPVAALRNGTIGWTLAGQQLEHGQSRTYPAPASPAYLPQAAREARALADRAGVQRADPATLAALRADAQRTTYFFDVRSPEEYAQGRLPGFRSAPGGQLVQETEQFGPVRGARFVLADLGGENGDGDVRANMTASWLRQMNHEVYVADGVRAEDLTERGDWKAPLPPLPATEQVDAATLAAWLAADPLATVVLDLTTSANHARSHIAGAWFALRSDLKNAIASLPLEVQAGVQRYVLTCGSSLLALFAAEDLKALTDLPVLVLSGGNAAWSAAGYATESGLDRLLSPAIDRYRRPYEGTDNPVEAMQAYLDWEYGLVAQLGRDGTHGFRVL
jgi:rhodanese-related sulfurtransferase